MRARGHRFPKRYDVLSLELIEAVVQTSGPKGLRVVREGKFQGGDRRCVFRVLRDQPVSADAPFTLEAPLQPGR